MIERVWAKQSFRTLQIFRIVGPESRDGFWAIRKRGTITSIKLGLSSFPIDSALATGRRSFTPLMMR